MKWPEGFEGAVTVGMGPAFWAARNPGAPAIISPAGDRTFGELNANANQLVRALRTRGLAAGDGVALLCANRAEFAEVWAACTRAGFRLTTVNWHLTAEEAAYIVEDCQAKALVADAGLGEAVPSSPVPCRLSVGGELAGFEPYAEVLAGEDGSDITDPSLGTAMLYTSGTTGYPKGVRKPPDPAGYVAAIKPYLYTDGHVHLCTGPLYHAAPFAISLVAPVTCGVPVVVMDRWDPYRTLELIEGHRVTHTHLVPTMFHRLLALPDEEKAAADTSSLLAVVHGAAPCPVETKRAMIDWWGPVLVEYYSATEGGGMTVDSRTWLTKPGTVGRIDPEALYVGDEDGNHLPTGSEGTVWLRATGVARFDYFGDEAKTAAAYRGDHFTLGDVGRVDDDGFLFLTDRSANLIISGGVNIYPAEIDAVLLGHPAVGDAAAIGIPDEEWGESVLAVVETRDGVAAGPDLAAELLASCRERLASYKCPRGVDFVDRLPRDDNGKIYKRCLRDEYRERSRS